MNVGEFDKETTQSFGSTEEGIRAYLDLMFNNYRPESGNYSDLMNPGGFVNQAGNRYASDPNYEKNVAGIMRMLEEGKPKGFGPYSPFPR
jgi:flagellum-specific peptidoglycan hydrolase FlgJ